MNEGLETIGSEIFRNSGIKRIAIPKSIITIDNCAFEEYTNLREVVFEEGSKLEEIGFNCFRKSELEEIALPKKLKKIGESAFENCESLKIIHLDDECEASLYEAEIPDSTIIDLLRDTAVFDMKLLDLKNCKHVVIPDSVEKIGSHWFCGSEIENVEIPASVKEIGADAFFRCRHLKSVVFAEGSKLEKIGPGSFYGTGIEKIAVPKSVTEIEEGTFRQCEELREVVFEEGSKL